MEDRIHSIICPQMSISFTHVFISLCAEVKLSAVFWLVRWLLWFIRSQLLLLSIKNHFRFQLMYFLFPSSTSSSRNHHFLSFHFVRPAADSTQRWCQKRRLRLLLGLFAEQKKKTFLFSKQVDKQLRLRFKGRSGAFSYITRSSFTDGITLLSWRITSED